MRRRLPEPHLTDRRGMWRVVGAVLAVAVVITVIEVVASDQSAGAFWTGLFPLVGAVAAPVFGPKLRPRASFRVGWVFALLGIASAGGSAWVFRGTPVGVAELFHFVTVVMFAAVFYDRRDVVLVLGLVTTIITVVSFAEDFTASRLLVWLLSVLVISQTGLVVSLLVERQRALSYRDPLTGIPNRRMWDLALEHEVGECRRRSMSVAVMLVDIDHFKEVNLARGHDGGDEVLRSAAAAWRPLVRASDVLARIGGDEFALVLPRCSTAAAERLGLALVAACREATGASCSIGAVAADDDRGSRSTVADHVAALVQAADRQLYEAKAAGRDRVHVGPFPAALPAVVSLSGS